MAILRRLLYLDALLSALGSVVLLAAPRFLEVTVLGQPEPPDYAFLRLLGVARFVLALLMVLVGHRIEDLWWWSWAFVILEFGGGAVGTVHAAFGVSAGAPSWPWWLLGGGSWALCFGFLWGLARSGAERPLP